MVEEDIKTLRLVWLPKYQAYQQDCKVKGEPAKNVNDWLAANLPQGREVNTK